MNEVYRRQALVVGALIAMFSLPCLGADRPPGHEQPAASLAAGVEKAPAAAQGDFPVGTFSPRPGPQLAPLGQVEITKKGAEYFLRFRMANRWEESLVKPMNMAELKGALGQEPASVNARGLSNGSVAFVLVRPNTKIRAHTISTGIVLISPFLGPSGTAELARN